MDSDQSARTLLDVLITARRWTVAECVRHFAEESAALGESATLSEAQLKRWRRGRLTGLPRPTACRVAEHLFGYRVEDLFAPTPPGFTPPQAATSPVRPGLDHGSGGAVVPLAARWGCPPSGQPVSLPESFLFDLEPDPIMSAAHDASEHAADAGRAIDETTLEQLHSEVTRLARAYAGTAPVVMFTQLARARDLTYRMLERTRRPAQTTELYLIAGQLSGLMAATSFDLGQPDAAGEQARAALTYGQVIDHNTLRAWARATLAMIAFWSGHPRDGVAHTQAGLEFVATGDTAVRLHCLAGRSWALTGSHRNALDALRAGEEARQHDRGADPFADQIGGEFAFGPARQALCTGAAHLALGDPHRAVEHTQAALDLYTTGPSEQRAIGGIHGARVELATAHALGADLDAVIEAVTPTLELGPEQRTHRLATRLHRLHDQLKTDPFQGAIQASRLTEDIEAFLTTASLAPRALP